MTNQFRDNLYNSYLDPNIQIGDLTELGSSSRNLVKAISDIVVNVKDFGAKGNGTSNDTKAIQRAINFVAKKGGGTVLFPQGEYLTDQLTFNVNNVVLLGNQATLVSNLPVSDDLAASTLLFANPTKVRGGLVPTANITKGDYTISFSNVANIQVGDIVFIRTANKYEGGSGSSNYYMGSIRYVKAINGTQLILDSGVENSLSLATDGVTVDIIRAIKNITIKGLTFRLKYNSKQIGVWIKYCMSPTVVDCKFYGGDQCYMGVWLQSCFDGFASRNYCEEFLDDTQILGYGIYVSGHNMKVVNNTLVKCKHGVAGGDNSHRSDSFFINDNYVFDPQLMGIDVHGSADKVEMMGNIIYDVGKSYGNTGGLWARGRNWKIKNNTVIAADKRANATSIYGIKLTEIADRNIDISGNTVIGCDYGVKADEVINPISNLVLQNNTFVNVANGVYAKKLINSNLSDNTIEATAQGVSIVGIENSILHDNIISYGASAWGCGIYLDTETSKTWKNVSMRGNTIIASSASANSGIRVKSNYDVLNISNNTLDMSKTSAAPVLLSENTTLTKLVREKNIGELYYSSLPTATAFDRNRTIIVQGGAGIADKEYICMKTSTDTYIWVQRTTG